jgi:uncharacterized RDD family membrane protein YckC
MQSSTPAASSEPLAGTAPPNPSVAGSPIAPLTDRGIAAIIDIVVMSATFPVAGMWAAAQWGGATSNGFQLNGLPALFVFAVVGLVGFLYLWLGEGLFGATLGKAAMALRVRSAGEGGKAGLGRALTRTLLRAIDGIGVYLVGLVFALTSPTRQRLGDRVAGTVVVHVEARGKARPAAAIACVAILFASLAVAFGVHATVPAATIAASSTPQVTRAELGTGNTDDYQIVGAASTFAPSQANIVCVFQVEGVAAGTPVRSVWIADDVGNAAPPNTKLAEKSIAAPDGGEFSGDFNLSGPSSGWPVGKYHLDIYIGDTLAKSLSYTIAQS